MVLSALVLLMATIVVETKRADLGYEIKNAKKLITTLRSFWLGTKNQQVDERGRKAEAKFSFCPTAIN